MGEIYMAVNIINSKKYIGQTVCKLSNGKKWGASKRWSRHLQCATKNTPECRALENAIRKYGDDNFVLIILEECTIDKLNYWEDYYIKEYNTISPKGYNLMTGGGNGRLHHIETKHKMSITRTGKKHSDVTKEKMKNSRLGTTLSLDTRIKIGKSSKYRNMSDKNRKKITEALITLNLEELPMYIGYTLDRRYNRNIDVITVRCKQPKKFADKNTTLVEKIQLAIEYLQFHI